MLRIGLTGGIGSGKSIVSNLFSALGVPVFDADTIAREIVEPGRPEYNQVIDLFGKKIVGENGELMRDRIRELVFRDPELRRRLEAIIHPGVHEEMVKRVAASSAPYCILSIPLLVETGGNYNLDRILVVDATKEQQLERALKRDAISREQVLAIIESQAARQERLNAADDIIDNTGLPEDTERQVNELHRKYLNLASQNSDANRTHD